MIDWFHMHFYVPPLLCLKPAGVSNLQAFFFLSFFCNLLTSISLTPEKDNRKEVELLL